MFTGNHFFLVIYSYYIPCQSSSRCVCVVPGVYVQEYHGLVACFTSVLINKEKEITKNALVYE